MSTPDVSTPTHPAAYLGRSMQRAFDRIACGERMTASAALQSLFDDGLVARKRVAGETTYRVTSMARRRWEAWRDGEGRQI